MTKKLITFCFIATIATLFFVLETSPRSEELPEGDITAIASVFPIIALILGVLSLKIEDLFNRFSMKSPTHSYHGALPTSYLLRLVFAEAIAVLGFTLGFIARNPAQSYPYMIVSLILMSLTLFPKK